MLTSASAFHDEIRQQPDALHNLITFYTQRDGAARLAQVPRPQRVLLTGMGASYHAAVYASYLLRSQSVIAGAYEAVDLLNFDKLLLKDADLLIYVSQSGSSGEIEPLLAQLPPSAVLIAVTNAPESLLAQNARITLPLIAGVETTVATKTYVNALACLWLLARVWAGHTDGAAVLHAVADEIERLIAAADEIIPLWIDLFERGNSLLFLGHGVHSVTARQAAMMLGEWAKQTALASGIGAFRHGLIETVGSQTGAILFGAGGSTRDSVLGLAQELESYGAKTLSIVGGRPHESDSPLARDDFLAPLLDVIPAQMFAEALARKLGIPPGFRYIRKVVRRL
jgi:glucosamine--fructose-6-phosphate aminotransferase (isomerizing)